MLYDRPYMRAPEGGAPENGKTSMVTTLLVITIAVFVIQQVLNVFFPGVRGSDNHFLSEWFALSGEHFRELKVWTILSYGFLHSTAGLLHIAGNMLGLYFIGRMIEPVLGRERFLLLYLGSTLIGGLIYLAFHFNEYQPVVGASASIMGILAFFCMLRPEQPITLLLFFIIPVTMKPKWVLLGGVVISVGGLLLYELPNRSYVAHSAHLGGLLAGFLYYRYVYKGSINLFTSSQAKPSIEMPEWFKRKERTEQKVTYKVNRSSRDQLQEDVDRILDKINTTGFGSLTDDEKKTLDRAKDILSR